METFEKLQLKLLDFDEVKRKEWEENRVPYAAHIELTPKCNFSCIHCYLQNQHNESFLSYDAIIDILDVLHSKGILFLTLTGGEIFTRKDFCDIYMYAKKKGFLIELFTNGMLVDDEIIKMLKMYPPLLVDISIYGSNEETYKKVTGVSGAFNRVISNCKKLVAANIRVSLKSPVIKETMEEINSMQTIADEIGVPIAFSFEICATIDGDLSTKEHQLSLKEILKYEFENATENKSVEFKSPRRIGDFDSTKFLLYGCKIGKNSFVIDYNGNMCPCMKFKHKGRRLTRENFDDIWEEFGQYQSILMSDKCKCATCKFIDYCEVCSAEMDFLHGNPEFRHEQDCISAKARYSYYRNQESVENALNSIE